MGEAKMRVLVVGGAGYLGGALTDILQHEARDFTVYDSLVFEDHYLKKAKFVHGDIRDQKKLKPLLDAADGVIWLAAIVGDGACALNPELSAEINQESVKWLAANFSGRIIFTSTCSVYGAHDGLLNELSATNPLSIYAATKLSAEEYLAGKNAIIFRLGTLYGVGDLFSRVRMDLVANILTARAYYEGRLKVFGGDQYRPLLHVKDAAQAIADNIGASEPQPTGVFNLSGQNMKIIDLAKQVNDIVPTRIELVETSFEDSRNYQVATDRAAGIGFKPQFTVRDGIEEIYQLLQSGRIKDFNNPRYSNEGYLEIVHATKTN
jgi:nucleoside-diphosphate-sugar epimerase